MKRSWGGEVKNVSVLVAVGVGSDGYRRILGVCEGHKEDKAGWLGFLKHLKSRGLTGVRLVISDACLGLVEALGETSPEADWRRCLVHYYRNIFSHVPNTRVHEVAAMLKCQCRRGMSAFCRDKMSPDCRLGDWLGGHAAQAACSLSGWAAAFLPSRPARRFSFSR